MSSRERVHSLLIASKMTEVLNNISDMLDCQRRCSEDSVCQYAAHKAQENTCAFFKEHLAHETISRLMFQGWKYGRVTSTRVVSHFDNNYRISFVLAFTILPKITIARSEDLLLF